MRKKGGKKDVRNVWCSCYSKCLDAATATGGDGVSFTCTGCEREFDRSGMPRDQAEVKEDCRGCMALLMVIYQRERTRKATHRVREL